MNSELQHCKDDYFRYMPEISFTDDESQERNIASLYNTIDFYDPEFKRFRSVISIPPFALAHVSQEFYETEQKIWYLNSFALRHGYVFDGHMFSLVK
ncbi:MAG: hypothetical protein Q8O99_00880 [bacterium]|nr:hypothetical protein [bacterium]